MIRKKTAACKAVVVQSPEANLKASAALVVGLLAGCGVSGHPNGVTTSASGSAGTSSRSTGERAASGTSGVSQTASTGTGGGCQRTILSVEVGSPDFADPSQTAAFVARWDAFVSATQLTPTMLETNIDFTQPLDTWVASAQGYYTASWKGVASPALSTLIPLLGIPMALSGDDADSDFQAIAAGAWDAVLVGVIETWRDAGWTTLSLRPGWEMNGSGFPWTVTAANAADFVTAFQHIATLARSVPGLTTSIAWNPDNEPGADIAYTSYYPGNGYVDVIGLDIYGEPLESDAAPLATTGAVNLAGLLAFAQANHKRFALGEVGASDAAFPDNLSNVIAAAGVPVAYANIWDVNFDSQSLEWDQDPTSAVAWANAYRTIAAATCP